MNTEESLRLLLQDLRFLLNQPRTKIDCRLILIGRIEQALVAMDKFKQEQPQ